MRMPGLLCLAALLSTACHKSPGGRPELDCSSPAEWTQWGGTASHAGTVCASGQTLSRPMVDLVYDPFAEDEKAENARQPGGSADLTVHYQAPLVSGNDVFMEVKQGEFIPCTEGAPTPCGFAAWNAQVWTERGYRWQEGGTLAPAWRYASDWKPPPATTTGTGGPSWEPVFHAALHGNVLWVPAANGGVVLLDRLTGQVAVRADPFSGDARAYVAGPITTDADGRAIYNAVLLDPADPWRADAQGFLVKVELSGFATTRSFAALAQGAPGPDAACERDYVRPDRNVVPVYPLLNPDGSIAAPPTVRCGPQRPALNVAPAVGADGTIYTVSRAHRGDRDAFLVAVNHDLSPRWAASLRGRVHDGCGALVPANGQPGACRADAPAGIDPRTGGDPAGRALDDSTSSPVVLPDGSVVYGAFTGYNGFRGHLLKFGPDGSFTGRAYDFGWDSTPAFFAHGGTYSLVLKDNHYDTEGPYFITQLNADLLPEWKYASNNTRSCTRQGAGMTCVDDHPGGFEWCVNEVAIDRDGVVYGNSEDGNLYAIDPGGVERQRLFLDTALGAAYTPMTVDAKGRIYAQNNGHLFVVGGQ